ncbi:MAG: glutamate--tRNA ligase [Candidatus Woesearchaeota archaeon]|nr:glutamate--tRNA ligase [Candidatus Woesearchaeota archaeon]
MDIKQSVYKYALQNALKFDGKANQGAVIGKVLAEHPTFKSKVKEIAKEASEAIKKISKMSLDKIREELEVLAPELLEKKEHEKKGLHDLEKAETGKVVMRLAPYPSGPLHIGNARPAILNDEYVKKYDGKLLMIIDDTIGSEEKQLIKEAFDLIPEGLRWLGVEFEPSIIYKSDRLAIYYKYAEELIKKDKAYVCLCAAEELRKNRENQKDCEHRKSSVQETLKEWKNMLTKYKEGEAVLRLKTSMQHPNPAFRDRVLFRICEREHPKVGKKYKVWPMLELSWGIDDHLLGITHVIRGKELMMESEMEKFIWDIFGWQHPVLIHTGLLRLEGVKISKSKSSKEVLSGEYKGWDDPRTWSLQSLKRRGIKPEAIRKFILSFGLTQTEITVPVDILYSENRKLIEKEANRYFFVEDPKEIKIEKAPIQVCELDLHPDFKERGVREFDAFNKFYIANGDLKQLNDNKLYRLMDCLNFKKVKDKFVFESLEYEKYKDKGDRIMHWLPAGEELANVEILMDDGSIKKGLAEKSVKDLSEGTIVQFERFAFCRLDKKEKDKIVFWFAHK